MIRCWAAAVLLSGTVPAYAACPKADDLAQGIVLIDRLKGTQQIAYASVDLGQGLYWQGWQSTVFPDGWQIYNYQGLFEVVAVRNSGKHLKEVTYDRALADVFPLKVGAKHSYGLSHTNEDRGMTWVWQTQMEVLAETEVNIGGCDYDAFQVRFNGYFERSDGMKKDSKRTQMYVPELKVAFPPYNDGIRGLDVVRLLAPSDGLVPQPVSQHINAQLDVLNGSSK